MVKSAVSAIACRPGVTISNVSVNCPSFARGYFDGSNCNIGLDEGLLMTSGNIQAAVGPNNTSGFTGFPSAGTGPNCDMDLYNLANQTVYDCCTFEFDVMPLGDTIMFNYSFGSEEYLEYVGGYNDVFGFLISCPDPLGGNYTNMNVAIVPGTSTPVSVNNVNDVSNPTYYYDNGTGWSSPQNTDPTVVQFDGFTVNLFVQVAVVPCETYHLKMGIADAGDGVLDSGVFIEAGSLTSNAVSINAYPSINGFTNAIEGCVDAAFIFELDDVIYDTLVINFGITGTALMGPDYLPIPSSVSFWPGGPDSVIIPIIPLQDFIAEPFESVTLYLIDTCVTIIGYDSTTLWIQDSAVAVIAGGDTTVCAGIGAQLHASGGGYYSWTPVGGISDPTSADPWCSPAVPTMYYVTVDLGSCSDTDSVFVDVVAPPTASVAFDDTSLCTYGQSVQLIGYSSTGTGYWTPAASLDNANILNPTATPYTDTDYILWVDNGYCIVSDTVHVDVSSSYTDAGWDQYICLGGVAYMYAYGSGTILWQPGSSLSDSTSFYPVASPTVTTTYTVTFNAGTSCELVDYVTVFVDPPFAINAGPDLTICQGDSIQINITTVGGNGFPYFYWDPYFGLVNPYVEDPIAFPSTTTTYTVYGYSGNCYATDDVTVYVSAGPLVSAGVDQTICQGDSAALNATGATAYSWLPATNITDVNISNPSVFPMITTSYTVTGTDANGCEASDAIIIAVSQAAVDAGPDVSFCNGGSETLGGPALGGYSYQWSPSTGLNPDNTTPTLVSMNNTGSVDITITYTLMATNPAGCIVYDVVDVTVYADPVADAGQGDTILMTESTTLNASGGITYSWSPDSTLTGANTANPTATPTVTTTYTVTITDANGCISTDDVTIVVIYESAVHVPNAFSPNNDGYNDVFQIFVNGNITLDQWDIYNRWGQLVFTTTDKNAVWDGTVNGKEQDMGIYVYVVKAHDPENAETLLQGNITLLK